MKVENVSHGRQSYGLPDRIERLRLPERGLTKGQSVRDLERALDAVVVQDTLLDLTYADTKRFPPPTWALADFNVAASGHGMTYTPYRGDRGVREAVALHVSTFLGTDVDPDRELMLTPGTQAGLFSALASLVEKGDRVLLVDPDYLSDERILRYLGAEVEHVPLLWEDAGGATPDLDYLEQALQRGPRVLLFSHPNNPTGAVFDRDVLRRIADLAIRGNLLVIVDQLYSRLVYDSLDFQHLLAFDGMRERTVTLLGPSKTESMSGYRVGVAVAPGEVIDRMEDLQSVTSLRAPSYAQHTLVRWLDEDHEFVARRIAEYQTLRDDTLARLAQTDVLEVVRPSGSAYMFPRPVGLEQSDQDIALRLKRDAGVVINPGYQFGPRGTGHFRICFAQDEQVWAGAIERIIAVLSAMRNGR